MINVENEKPKVQYSLDEICPICGTYTPEGDVCPNCLKAHDLCEPKVSYTEE